MRTDEINILHVVPTLSQAADGVASFVRDVAESLNATGANSRVAALDWAPMNESPSYLSTFPLGWGPRRLGVSPQMHKWLKVEADMKAVDILHNHGLWMMPNVYAGDVCKKNNCRLMVSPHGAMSSWSMSRSHFVKKIFWRLFQEDALKVASCFHATSESEYQDIRRLGFRQPVCILPCGVSVPVLKPKQAGSRRQLLYLARIHPIKGVDILLQAWQLVENKFPDWDLVVAGPDNGGYLTEMQMLAKKLDLKRVAFQGPLYGDEKLRAYQNAELYVLPTHSENFGITVAEALAAGTPAIVTHGAPWAGLAEHGAGWWIDVGVDPLIACLEQALSTSPRVLKEMGQAGHVWMKRDFSWERISAQFLVTYRWLIDGGAAPPWIRLD